MFKNLSNAQNLSGKYTDLVRLIENCERSFIFWLGRIFEIFNICTDNLPIRDQKSLWLKALSTIPQRTSKGYWPVHQSYTKSSWLDQSDFREIWAVLLSFRYRKPSLQVQLDWLAPWWDWLLFLHDVLRLHTISRLEYLRRSSKSVQTIRHSHYLLVPLSMATRK